VTQQNKLISKRDDQNKLLTKEIEELKNALKDSKVFRSNEDEMFVAEKDKVINEKNAHIQRLEQTLQQNEE